MRKKFENIDLNKQLCELRRNFQLNENITTELKKKIIMTEGTNKNLVKELEKSLVMCKNFRQESKMISTLKEDLIKEKEIINKEQNDKDENKQAKEKDYYNELIKFINILAFR